MTTTYNVNITGSLTNNNGILSNFSTGNYAKLPTNFNPSNSPWEIVFKFTTGNNFNSEVCIVSQTDTNWNGLKLDIDNGFLWFAVSFTDNTSSSITGNTTLNTNTTYYVKIIYNTTNYRMFISTDGINFTLEETLASSKVISIPDDFTIGWMKCATSRYFNGSIDLNGSYIKINNLLWWQGATSTSQAGIKIQLRHDTAANWTSVNPVLLEGEVGIETDTKKQKIGDGSTPWNNLAYDLGSTALQSITSSDVTTALGYTPVNTNLSNLSTTGQKVIDGQPVAKYLLVDNTKTAHSASADLSSYINDSTTASYEVLVELNIESNNSTSLWVGNITDPYTNQYGNAFCIGTQTTSGSTQQHFACWLPLATSSRTLYYQLAGSTASVSANVNLLGYRRLGTNS